MASRIKHTQLTRVGYSYQDLFCIQLLLEWFRCPDKYQWVAVESDDTEKGKFKGLDDVVALNQEGRYELYQVKFTIDSQRDDLNLSFDWLLAHKKRGTSFLQKWAHDVAKYDEDGDLSIAALKTNRVPDDEISKCLKENKIDIDLIPDGYLKTIDEQLGGRKQAKAFFEKFTFDHSQQEIDDFENKLHDSVVPDHSTTEGWLTFLRAVERWATRKDQPSPDGRIKIEHIRELLTTGASRTISQFFEVPPGYVPPSEEFHSDIVDLLQK